MITSRELFDAAVRTTGFLIVLHGVWLFFWGLLYLVWPHYWDDPNGSKEAKRQGSGQFFFASVIETCLGVFVIGMAANIVALCY